ncbi:rab-GTPase-TBC domain-containing protein [Pilobolus umbonatus]|nr:rab-GTPase-TBC domain-containing protein [Pilobolus umbonatus]
MRGKLWKLFLRTTHVSAGDYIHLVELKSSSLDEKIRNDSFRTMTTDTTFLEQVSEDMLIRLLNAFVWTTTGESEHIQSIVEHFVTEDSPSDLTYVQGMNVLAAPFLMTMPEMDAFFCFSTFIWKWCPLYVQPTMKGVHCGVRLLESCLLAVDPSLYGYLRGKNLSTSTYAFAPIMTFSACTPPLSELLQLWDYMFAYGLHLNIIFIIAQLSLIRHELIHSPSPIKILRVFPPLNAKKIIITTKSICKRIPPGLYDKLVRHAYDESVSDELGIKATSSNNSQQYNDLQDVPAYLQDILNNRNI